MAKSDSFSKVTTITKSSSPSPSSTSNQDGSKEPQKQSLANQQIETTSAANVKQDSNSEAIMDKIFIIKSQSNLSSSTIVAESSIAAENESEKLPPPKYGVKANKLEELDNVSLKIKNKKLNKYYIKDHKAY
jgi:hypothetical protein